MNLTLAQADEYFTTHLEQSDWAAQDATIRQAALVMAYDDVLARLGLGELDNASQLQCHAVYEQAAFLVRHYGRISRSDGEIASEEISDAGKRSYLPNPHPGMAPRAMALIRRLVGRALSRG